MCLQCLVDAEVVSEDFLPGYYLMVAKKDHEEWNMTEYGLVEVNDPTFIFSIPEKNNCNSMEKLREELDGYCSIDSAYNLVRAAKKVGYRPKTHGFLACFLLSRMQKMGLLKDNSKTDWLK